MSVIEKNMICFFVIFCLYCINSPFVWTADKLQAMYNYDLVHLGVTSTTVLWFLFVRFGVGLSFLLSFPVFVAAGLAGVSVVYISVHISGIKKTTSRPGTTVLLQSPTVFLCVLPNQTADFGITRPGGLQSCARCIVVRA